MNGFLYLILKDSASNFSIFDIFDLSLYYKNNLDEKISKI
jgi:hypothetical protein